MNYIGSKNKLSTWIKQVVSQTVSAPLDQLVFCDLFAGTGIVGRNFKPIVKKVIANDVEYYSYVLQKNYIGNHRRLEYQLFLEQLNELKGKKGMIFNQFSENGEAERLYFNEKNGQKIDAARQEIESWKKEGKINENLYFFLLASLLESADKVANTASVYGAFLKNIKATAGKTLAIRPAFFAETENSHEVYREDANSLIRKISGNILYLDPPYNARQYGANYHLLNTIAKYDDFQPKGKTGLREYYRSAYCQKGKVETEFENLIKSARFRYIFLSYNNEGLMSPETIRGIMSKYGDYHLETKEYQRFKADKTENRNHIASNTTEFLHILKKSKKEK